MPTFSKFRKTWSEKAKILGHSPECDFVTMTLKQFLVTYADAICEYIEDDDYFSDVVIKNHKYEIMCLVDVSDVKKHTMDDKMRQSLRRAGKERREKIKDKYHYKNPFNRIHAYAILENVNKDQVKHTMCINVICTSHFSDQKGLGTFLMNYLIQKAQLCGFKNIILEAGNQEATTKMEDMDGLSEESYDDEEEDEEEEDEEEEDEEEEDEEEEDVDYDDLIMIIKDNLWKKCVRHDETGPIYNIDEEYIGVIIADYLYDTESEFEDFEIPNDDIYGYGGYYYTKGKNASKRLIDFYQRFGFKEDPRLNTEYKCFGECPYPSMILTL